MFREIDGKIDDCWKFNYSCHPISPPQKFSPLTKHLQKRPSNLKKAKIIKSSSHFIKFSAIFHERKENARNYDKKSTFQADKSR
jgi:hypothetical protein